jgi:biotin synthase
MSDALQNILNKTDFTAGELQQLIALNSDDDCRRLWKQAEDVRNRSIGNTVYLRGLIELSNHCEKNCYYCGIRAGNHKVRRYEMPDNEVLDAATLAWKAGFGSVVLQAGERTDSAFIKRVEKLIRAIKEISENQLGITLSLGEQTEETYRRWFDAGAHRYLLRVETTARHIYSAIHPAGRAHRYENRINALQSLFNTGYQTGTGVMIGLPGQSSADLAADLLFFRDAGIHMVGMGPYVEHPEAPLAAGETLLLPERRLTLALNMIAALRLLIPDINIASATALESIHPDGRELGIMAGANIVMPNISPVIYKANYLLYNNKPSLTSDPALIPSVFEERIRKAGCVVGYNVLGDSKRFRKPS